MESGSHKFGTFKCPDGFEPEIISSSQLYLEDVDDDDCELWLVRMPADVDPSVIEGQPMAMDGQTYSLSLDEGLKRYHCSTDVCTMPNLCVVLPKKDSKDLVCVKKSFKGNVYVTEQMVLNDQAEENGVENIPPQVEDSSDMKTEDNVGKAKRSKSRKKEKSREVPDLEIEPLSDLDSFPNCKSQIH